MQLALAVLTLKPWQACTHRGLLSVHANYSKSLGDLEQDYGVKFAAFLKKALVDFCTCLGERQHDTDLYTHIVENIVGIYGDGAVQKSLSYLRETCLYGMTAMKIS